MFDKIDKVIKAVSKRWTSLNKDIGETPEPRQRKGKFEMFSSALGVTPEGKVQKPQILAPSALKRLSNTDPITWAIKYTRKEYLKMCKWKVTSDIDIFKNELEEFEDIEEANINDWGYRAKFKPKILKNELYEKIKKMIGNIPNNESRREKISRIKWIFKMVIHQYNLKAQRHADYVESIIKKPCAEYLNLNTLLSVVLDDMLVFDAGVIIKNKSKSGKTIAELYTVPGEEVFMYRNKDRTVPKPPEPAYIWEVAGTEVAKYTVDELMYMMMNPQQHFYGMSPVEVCAYIITSSLYADSFNMEFFRHSNIPPVLINLGEEITDDQRTKFRAYWNQEIKQEGGLWKAMFMSGSKDPSVMPLMIHSNKDMQMMEYLKWTLSIKCAAFQVAPQDIYFTMDLHRTTSEVQERISHDRGMKNILYTFQEHFNSEIIPSFGFKDIKMEFVNIDTQDAMDELTKDHQDINNGIICRNDRRKRLGLRPIEGGDVIMVKTDVGDIPIGELDNYADLKSRKIFQEEEQGQDDVDTGDKQNKEIEYKEDKVTKGVVDFLGDIIYKGTELHYNYKDIKNINKIAKRKKDRREVKYPLFSERLYDDINKRPIPSGIDLERLAELTSPDPMERDRAVGSVVGLAIQAGGAAGGYAMSKYLKEKIPMVAKATGRWMKEFGKNAFKLSKMNFGGVPGWGIAVGVAVAATLGIGAYKYYKKKKRKEIK